MKLGFVGEVIKITTLFRGGSTVVECLASTREIGGSNQARHRAAWNLGLKYKTLKKKVFEF